MVLHSVIAFLISVTSYLSILKSRNITISRLLKVMATIIKYKKNAKDTDEIYRPFMKLWQMQNYTITMFQVPYPGSALWKLRGLIRPPEGKVFQHHIHKCIYW
jgi:hypothetical protein